MKFVYEYRTPDNEKHTGEIKASDREAAYAQLKKQGIRPSRFSEAPGLFNKLFGKGKRWIAIGVLALLVVVLAVALDRARTSAAPSLWAQRSQLYGDPYVIENAYQNLWRNYLPELGDSFLALYAVPGHRMIGVPKSEYDQIMKDLGEGRFRMLEVRPDDLEEVAKMKRMVNGMKLELQRFIDDGGTPYEYAKELVIRAKAEIGIYQEALRLAQKGDEEKIAEKNRQLRAMGLPLVQPPVAALPKESQKFYSKILKYPLDGLSPIMVSYGRNWRRTVFTT